MTNVGEAVNSSAVARSQRRRYRGRGAGRTPAHHGESGGRGRSTPPDSSGSTCLTEPVALVQVSARATGQEGEVVALAAGRGHNPGSSKRFPRNPAHA